jgi:hypothetical protein
MGVIKRTKYGFHVFPRRSYWHKRAHLDLLLACEEEPELAGVHVPWLSYTADKDKDEFERQHDFEYTDVMTSGFMWPGAGSVIFHGVDCEYMRACGEGDGDWRALLNVSHVEFNQLYRQPVIPTGEYRRGDISINAFECRASDELPIDKLVHLMCLFDANGHTVLATTGFKIA